jgi:rod shape-determining protein MreD
VDAAAVRVDPRAVARTTAVLFAATVLQIGMFNDLSVLSVHGDLLLSVAIATAVAWGADRGAIVGFAAGLLADVNLSGRFGLSGLAFGLAGYAVGLASDAVVRRSRMIDAGLMAAGSALGVLLYALVATLFGEGALGDDHLWRIIGIEALFSTALSPLLVPLCRWAGTGGDRVRPVA